MILQQKSKLKQPVPRDCHIVCAAKNNKLTKNSKTKEKQTLSNKETWQFKQTKKQANQTSNQPPNKHAHVHTLHCTPKHACTRR